MAYSSLLAFLLAAVLVVNGKKDYPKTACGSGPSHNLLLGNRTYGDRLLYSGNERIESSMLRVKTTDFKWPLHKQSSSREVITMIEAIDRAKDGSGGCAFLVKGGPGSQEAKIHIKTQRGGEADFHVSIYGSIKNQ